LAYFDKVSRSFKNKLNMKLILTLIYFLLFTHVSVAEICDPMAINGNSNWINPEQITLFTTAVPSDFLGGNCKDQVVVNSVSGLNGFQDDFSYFLPEIKINDGRFNYDFAIDFAEILSFIGTGNRIDFFGFFVTPSSNDQSAPYLTAKIRIKKKPLTAGGYSWKVHVLWYDLPDDTGYIQVNYQHHFWLPSDVTTGLLHFYMSWTDRNFDGSITTINVSSNLRRADNSHVQMDISEYANTPPNPEELVGFMSFVSPYHNNSTVPAEVRLGIINHDDGVNNGDGLTFYTPFRF